MSVCVCVCVCVLYREGSRVFASTVLISCIDDRVTDRFNDYDRFLRPTFATLEMSHRFEKISRAITVYHMVVRSKACGNLTAGGGLKDRRGTLCSTVFAAGSI